MDNNSHTLQDRRNSVVVLTIYEDKEILLLFCDHQENESESQEIYILHLDQYSTRKISKSLWNCDMHITHDGRKILYQSFMFMEIESSLYYFMMTKTLDMSNMK